jgi:putative phage-type endonuclease
MTIEILEPRSRDEWLRIRQQTIGASEIAALVGASPWETAFSLYSKRVGNAAPEPENAAMRRGRHLEAVAIEMLREERPDWIVKANPMPGGVFYRDLDAGISATPDAFVSAPGRPNGICQIKSVQKFTFDKKWKNADGEIEPPLHVVIQAVQEAALTGAEWACVAALVIDFGIDLPVIEIEIHGGIIARMRKEAADFWRRVTENNPPPPDYAKDGALIASIYADSDDDLGIDLGDNPRVLELLDEREKLKMRETDGERAAKMRKPIDAELVHILGNASTGRLADGRIITAKTTRRAGYEVKPTSFRSVRIKEPK